jgi:hypothetical protein
MAFFGLTDIKFNDIGRRGPLNALESSEKFSSSILRYPEDVASAPDRYHYMMFFVREQVNTGFSSANRGYGQSFSKEDEKGIFDSFNAQVKGDGLVSASSQAGLAGFLNNALSSGLSKGANILTGKGGATGKVGSVISGFVNGPTKATSEPQNNSAIQASVKEITDKSPFGFLNKTRLTKDAIALYMPDTINFDSTASYSDLRPGEEKLGQFLAAAPELIEAYKKGGGVALGKTALKSGVAQLAAQETAVGAAGQTGRLGVYAATGKVTNPMIELIYGSPDLRTFQFEFMFYPRSEKEAYEVQRIIDRFRFHQAPELDKYESGRQTGMLIPPSEFDIKFYYAGKQNPNIPPIASCVLTNVQVNFAPRGWSAYESLAENTPALGRTGMPTAIQMSLQFRETTYITKEDFSDQSASKVTQSQAAQSGGQSGTYLGRQAAFGKTA